MQFPAVIPALVALFSTILFAPLKSAVNYELIAPPAEVTTDLRASFSLIASHIVEIGPLKSHPKITWLDHSSLRLLNGDPTADGKIRTTLGFVVRSPGTVKFPPIPIVIENDSFLLRLPTIKAVKNRSSKDFAQLDILWNEAEKIPEVVHLGETIEIDYIGRIITQPRKFPEFQSPTSRVDNARWHLFTRRRGQNARADDYFYGVAQRSGFIPSGYFRRYLNGDSELFNQHARLRRYRARIVCAKLGEVRGHFGMTFRSGTNERTFLKPYKFNVVPLPPLPNENIINSGLVGDWDIKARVSPSRITTSKPVEIAITIEGQGDPGLSNEFDFSTAGFPSVDRQPALIRDPNYLKWNGRFSQTLVPTGKVASLPALTIATFDTTADQWKLHPVSPSLTLVGMTDITDSMAPATTLGKTIQRPILLNLPTAIFGAFALAPFLPFFFGFLKKHLDQRDPERKARRHQITSFIIAAQKDSANIEDGLLPTLRAHLNLPSGASTGEIAQALESSGHIDVANSLRTHSEASFSSSAQKVDLKQLAKQLTKITFLFMFSLTLIPQIQATTLESANAAYAEARYSESIAEYQELISESPGQAILHRNLALAYLSADDPAQARAACHTSLLLSPLDGETRDLMNDIRTRLSAPTLPGMQFLELRPDQWFVAATLIWVLGFVLLGSRTFTPRIPRWTAWSAFTLTALFIAAGIWRNSSAYQDNQYMVLGKEVPREPKIGNPDWDFPPLSSGQIIQIVETNKSMTHGRIETPSTTFWVPLNELKQVW